MNYNIITYNGLADRQEMIKVFDLPDSVPLFVNDNNLFCLDDDDTLKKELSAVLKAPIINYKQLVFVPSNPLVSGVYSFQVLYSSKYDKLVIMVGEEHTYSENKMCKKESINSSEFVKEMLKSTSKKQDVFIEDVYMPHVTAKGDRFSFNVMNTSFMGQFIYDNKELNCMTNDRQNSIDCKEYGVNHVRFHRADIRPTEIYDNTIVGYLNLIFSTYSVLLDRKTDPSFISRASTVYKYITKNFTKYNDIELIKKEITDLVKLVKIQKQLDSISDPLVRKEIMRILEPIIHPTNRCLNLLRPQELLKILDVFMNTPIKTDSSTATSLNPSTHHFIKIKDCHDGITLAMMDGYLLARLFKTHINPDDTPKNVIIYAGGAHTELYTNVLKSIGFTVLFDAPKLNSLCVDLSGLKIKWL